VIAGAGKDGIGQAIAQRLSDEGYDLVLADCNEEAGLQATGALRRQEDPDCARLAVALGESPGPGLQDAAAGGRRPFPERQGHLPVLPALPARLRPAVGRCGVAPEGRLRARQIVSSEWPRPADRELAGRGRPTFACFVLGRRAYGQRGTRTSSGRMVVSSGRSPPGEKIEMSANRSRPLFALIPDTSAKSAWFFAIPAFCAFMHLPLNSRSWVVIHHPSPVGRPRHERNRRRQFPSR
jgi:hypothetical protein